MATKALFTGGLRTPFARAGKGEYADVRPDDLLVELFRAQKERNAELWNSVPEDVVVGCAYPEGEQGYNVARMAALGAGLETTGVTVNRLCASSMEVAAIAAGRIHAGWGEHYLLGGVESMSRIPRGGANASGSDAITEVSPHAYITMGETAEEVAKRYPNISRAAQEQFAGRSHELAHQAYQAGHYAKQIHPFKLEHDGFIRIPVNYEKMASLPPAFREDGVVTAATSSPLTDGATSGWVLSEERAKSLGVATALELVDVSWSHVAPEVMGIGPFPATQAVLKKQGLSVSDIDAFEINEAFAVQVLASADELSLSLDKVNSWGGAMAVGHPLGASGLRLLMTLHGRLEAAGNPGALGVCTLCVGGGQGMAILCRYVEL